MSAKLSVIFYIILCLEIGIVLDAVAVDSAGHAGPERLGQQLFSVVRSAQDRHACVADCVASGWMRGAVTGLGLLNIGIAFWEIFHFKQTVRALQESTEAVSNSSKNAAPDHPRDQRRHGNSRCFISSRAAETTAQTTPATEDFSEHSPTGSSRRSRENRLGPDPRKESERQCALPARRQRRAMSPGEAQTSLLVNDRADIAAAAGADGVHLTTSSLPAEVVRRTFGDEFLDWRFHAFAGGSEPRPSRRRGLRGVWSGVSKQLPRRNTEMPRG